MDANRSMIVLAVGASVVLAVLMALLPLLLQGVNKDTVQTLSSRAVTDDLYEDLDRDARGPELPRGPRVRRAQLPPSLSEAWTPRTLSEKRWAETIAYSEARAQEAEDERAGFESFREFMSTPSGGDLQAAFELLRRSKPKEASELLERALPALAELPLEVQQPLLTGAIRLFKEAGRMDLLSQSLQLYLENTERTLEGGGLEGRTRDQQARMLDDVRAMLREVRARGPGGS